MVFNLLNNAIFFSKVQTAKLALRRLKTLRHPNILRYIDALEVRIKEMFIDSSLLSPCYNYIYRQLHECIFLTLYE